MNLEIERSVLEALIVNFPHRASLADQLRFGNKAQVAFANLEPAEIDCLIGLYRAAGPDKQTRVAEIVTLRRALCDGGARFAAHDLEGLLPAMARYLIADAIHGWMFAVNLTNLPLPYVVTRIDYTPPSNDEPGRVFVDLKANAKGAIATTTLRISTADIVGKTVAEIFAAKGFLKETPELVAAHEVMEEQYFAWRGRYGEQFTGAGVGFYAEDPNASHRDVDWSRKDIVVLSSAGGSGRLVNDEAILSARALSLEVTGDVLGAYLRKAAKSNLYDAEADVEESRAAIPKSLFKRIPVHPYMLMFHLELHHHIWVHVAGMAPYAYRPELKKKLVLPEEQTDLIDILTAEMDVLMDDIVAGKSGGTTVLCAGPPGVGKTLTAEVYSEIGRRPLYRIHSGQLGLNAASMESALKVALTRAQRWGAVMLIDEADVYIKRREDDIAMNAVVGVFLRVLEYFNGLLFLTTNRIDDIDEAIVSRCIALIRFHPPDAAARRRIWSVMTEQFGLDVEAALLDALVDLFPAASGRDIKGLAKLVAKYCGHRRVAPTRDVFERCAIFRGVDAATSARA